MISLVGKRPKTPAGFADSSKNDRAKLARWVKKGKKLDKDSFKPKKWNAYKHILTKAQHAKCAYCEMAVSAKNNGVIDHYRPKLSVQALEGGDRDDTKGKPAARNEKAPVEAGYWWLAYTWNNFLVTCRDCNEVWKQSQFPISGERAKRKGELKSEGALLLNPFDVDPSGHFQYDLTGQMDGTTEQGKATADVCGLDRRSLENSRLIKVNKVCALLKELGEATAERNTRWRNHVLLRLLEECADGELFAGTARWLLARDYVTYDELLQAKRQGLF